jgi:Fe(3+) dicitrate transport protein
MLLILANDFIPSNPKEFGGVLPLRCFFKALKMKKILTLLVAICSTVTGFSQKMDTIKAHTLPNITISSWRAPFQPVTKLAPVYQTYLLAGKNTAVINLDQTPANIAEKTVRQVFAKIPGAFAYDMDGSGNQVNLALRGLDPHRSWEMNVRQNGIMTNSDIYGYPASHYSPPMEAIERIELVRGTAALQYGAGFGGMINYITRQPDSTSVFSFENRSAAGSFGLLSTYNAIGGHSGKVTWNAYYSRRSSAGYRDNSRSDYNAQFGSVTWQVTPSLSLRGEMGRSAYVYQLPGPLNDSMFHVDPRQSTRNRNYYSPDITIPSLTLNWAVGHHTQFQWIVSHVGGWRNSVMFIGASDKIDAINPQTGEYIARQVDIDHFNSSTSEARLTHAYNAGKMSSVFATGVRMISNDLNRRQLGKGSTGTDYDLTLSDPNWGRDLHYKTRNIAFFAENLLNITPSFSVSPGIRVESGNTRMDGVLRVAPTDGFQTDIAHEFVLFGATTQFKPSDKWRVFGGYSQAYRPVVLGEIIPANSLEKIDPNLKDAHGYNAELGVESNLFDRRLQVNATLFRVEYNGRIGNQAQEGTDGQTYFLKTNIGDSRTDGIECYAEGALVRTATTYIALFTATAYMDGAYRAGQLAIGSKNIDLKGKKVESVPAWTSRNGLQVSWKQWNLMAQYSYVDKSYADPINTEKPNPNGTRGIVPAYGIWDLHLGCRISSNLRFNLSVNNLTDKQYFTKRPSIYPGPGVWSSDGRGIVGSVVCKLGSSKFPGTTDHDN